MSDQLFHILDQNTHPPEEEMLPIHTLSYIDNQEKETLHDLDNQQTKEHFHDFIEILRAEADIKIDPEHRAELGQFFTPVQTSKFMAGLFETLPSTLCLLDAGSGIGSLTAAFIAEVCSRENDVKEIHAVLYEIDPKLIKYMERTLEECRKKCSIARIKFTSTIFNQDFISHSIMLQQGGLFAAEPSRFDRIILNPPYRKINNETSARKLLKSVGIDISNLYAAFLWLATNALLPGGELVAITPRSFCNGPYFKSFRKAFLKQMYIKRIHILNSRDQAFQENGVLQENIIFHAKKSEEKREKVVISSSRDTDYSTLISREIDYNDLVLPDDPELFIRIIPNERAHQIAQRIQKLTTSLTDLGIAVSTGRVVDFRAKDFLRANPEENTVPLIWPNHLSQGKVIWPDQKNKKPNALVLAEETRSILIPNECYVLVKRFSSKEELRRITAILHDPLSIDAKLIGFENHLNYYHAHGQGLSLNLAKGLTAYLTSTVVDSYFRQFNGHTQVNATDLRQLPYPTKQQLENIGLRLHSNSLDQMDLDYLVEKEIFNMIEDTSASRPTQTTARIAEAIAILKDIGLPEQLYNDRSALTLLALLNLEPQASWSEAQNPMLRTRAIMDAIRDRYGKDYKANTRETIRKDTLQTFIEAGLIEENADEPKRPPNSPKWNYRICQEALDLFRSYNTGEWSEKLRNYLLVTETLIERYKQKRKMNRIPIRLPDGTEFSLSPGGQNELIEHILEDFVTHFTPGATLLYVGDADDKWGKSGGYSNMKALEDLGLVLHTRGKIPDVVVHYVNEKENKNWLVLIEAVNSGGPVHSRRRDELKNLFSPSGIGLLFVTAFPNRTDMIKYIKVLAWKTEIWLADEKFHIIHFDGERFLGPYEED